MSEEIIRYVNAACEGDVNAIGMLYTKTLRISFYLAKKLSNDEAAAVEIAKKAYARSFCTINKLKKPEAFEIWMKQNVASVYKESQNFIYNEAEGGVQDQPIEFLSSDVIGDSEKSAAVLNAVSELPSECRTAVVLQYLCGMPVASLSKFLGVSESTVNAVLAKSKEAVLSACEGCALTEIPVNELPVLTRLFQDELAQIVIDPSSVREIFTYVLDIFNSFRIVEAQKANSEPSIPGRTTGEKPQEVPKSQYFSAEKKDIFTESSDENEPDIPVKTTQPPRAFDDELNDEIDFDRFVDEPVEHPSKSKFDIKGFISNFDLKNIGIKKMIIGAAAIIVLILIISGIAKGIRKGGSKPENNKTEISQNTSAYMWTPGGFEQCKEIKYLNENYCSFKSAETGKYGLLDYKGNVVLQPNYDGFENCSNGKDYTNRGNYHITVTIDYVNYEIIDNNGQPEISPYPHSAHNINNDELEKGVSYDERDRYFNGYAAARKNGKWGYVDQEKDKKVIPFNYDAVNEIASGSTNLSDYCRPVSSDGLIPVKKDGLMGIINLDNDTVVPFEYTNIMPGSDGVFIAQKGDVWGVITTGNAVYSFGGVNIRILAAEEEPTGDEGTAETGKYRVVSEGGANVRSGAGADYELVGTLEDGDEIDSLGTKEAENGKTWIKIKLDDGSYGYVSISVLNKISE